MTDAASIFFSQSAAVLYAMEKGLPTGTHFTSPLRCFPHPIVEDELAAARAYPSRLGEPGPVVSEFGGSRIGFRVRFEPEWGLGRDANDAHWLSVYSTRSAFAGDDPNGCMLLVRYPPHKDAALEAVSFRARTFEELEEVVQTLQRVLALFIEPRADTPPQANRRVLWRVQTSMLGKELARVAGVFRCR